MNTEVGKSSTKKLPVVEIFGPTIEGEGSIIGMQTMFIRLGLCDFKCAMCDSMHAVDPQLVHASATWGTQEEIANWLSDYMVLRNAHHIKNVVLSGGNPCIHDLEILVRLLHDRDMAVYVETQGTKCPTWLQTVDHITVSPKSPGMGEKFDPVVFATFLAGVPDMLDEGKITVKVVIFTAQDIEFAAAIQSILDELIEYGVRIPPLYLSLGNSNPPKYGTAVATTFTGTNTDTNSNLAIDLLRQYDSLAEDVMREPRLANARFLPQLHTLIWGNELGR